MYPRIRALRQDYELSQRELAQQLGMSQTGYSKYETGENDIPTSILTKLALLYQTSTDYLLGLTNEARPYPRGKDAGPRPAMWETESGAWKASP